MNFFHGNEKLVVTGNTYRRIKRLVGKFYGRRIHNTLQRNCCSIWKFYGRTSRYECQRDTYSRRKYC